MAKKALKATGGASILDDLVAAARNDFRTFVELMFPVLHQSERLVHAPYIDLIIEVLARSRKAETAVSFSTCRPAS